MNYAHSIKEIPWNEAFRTFVKFLIGCLTIIGLSGCGKPVHKSSPTASPTSTPEAIDAVQIGTPEPASHTTGISRGYLTTPQELTAIAKKAEQGLEPYHSAVNNVIEIADKKWDYKLKAKEDCSNSDKPAWNDNGKGTPRLYAKALAYQLTGKIQYAEEVRSILERIMTKVETIDLEDGQCQLAFGWGTPELVASADLIEDYWWNRTCTGPIDTHYDNTEIGVGNCKKLFQNWLVKNPYYIVSSAAEVSQSNWGAAATNTLAYIADYLWDRPEVVLIHRVPPSINNGKDLRFTASEAYAHANKLALDRMNGYDVEQGSPASCDYLSGDQQNRQWTPVKSQISEQGIIPEDARRQQQCNIPVYNGTYENYPQLHLGNNIQQCELMLRRGDSSCYDNVDNSDLPDYTFTGPDGKIKTTHLYPGRGSIERAIKAIIVDSKTEWRHRSALEVAFRYYFTHHSLPGFEQWAEQLVNRSPDCGQDICFGTLTHGFSIESETPMPPPTVPPP